MKTLNTLFLIALSSTSLPLLAQEIRWCGVDKDTGVIYDTWCWTSRENCIQGKPSHYICVAMPKPKNSSPQ